MFRSFNFKGRTIAAQHFLALLALCVFAFGTQPAQAQATDPPPYMTMFLNMQGMSGAANNAMTGAGGVANGYSSASDWSNMNGRIYGAAGPGGPCNTENCIGAGAEMSYNGGANADGWASHQIYDLTGGNLATYAGSSSLMGFQFQGSAGTTYVVPMIGD